MSSFVVLLFRNILYLVVILTFTFDYMSHLDKKTDATKILISVYFSDSTSHLARVELHTHISICNTILSNITEFIVLLSFTYLKKNVQIMSD